MTRAVVIGAGHNGLVAAVMLARAGLDVTVLEAFERPGGCIATEEIAPGHRADIGALEHAGIADGVAAELGLDVDWLVSDHRVVANLAERAIGFHRSIDETCRSLTSSEERFWRDFVRVAGGVNGLLHALEHGAPPPIGDLATAAEGIVGDELLRLLLTSAEEVAATHLGEEPALAAAACAYGSHGQIPPWLPGSGSFALWLPGVHGGSRIRPRGGSGALVDALVSALVAVGGRVRCAAEVDAIHAPGGRVAVIELSGGEVLPADVVVSTIDIVRTARLVEGAELPHPHLTSGRFGVGELKVDVAMDASPIFTGDPAGFAAAIRVVLPEHQGDAFRSIVAGRLPDPLPVLAAVPSADDPTRAPLGRATAWLSAFVPAGCTDERAMVASVMSTMDAVAPGFSSRVTAMRVTTPQEWERRTGNRFGNPNHIDLTFDQLLGFRPGPRTPIRGLYLSGAGTHPGGGVTGRPGSLTAQAVLADRTGRHRRPRRALARHVTTTGSVARSAYRVWRSL
jgi:beta-carotene ketolase (CrtO type)